MGKKEYDMGRFIFLYHNKNIGGIATLIIRLVLKFKTMGREILYIGRKDSYLSNFFQSNGIGVFGILETVIEKDVSYMEEIDLNYLRNIGNFLELNKEDTIFTFDFKSLMFGFVISERCGCKILTGLFHPEAWPMGIKYLNIRGKYQTRRKVKNSQWYYQRDLLFYLANSGALWSMNEIYKCYHEYYYEIKLVGCKIIPLPFEHTKVEPEINIDIITNTDSFSVLWIGRFDYFKNPSIMKVYKALLKIYSETPMINISFNIVGYGEGKRFEHDIQLKLRNSPFRVNFLGKIPHENLYKIIQENDIAICMGTSALHAASLGLPTIIVDAMDYCRMHLIKGVWFYESQFGYLGGGAYADLINLQVPNRKELYYLIKNYLKEKKELKYEIGLKCKKKAHLYCSDNIYRMILDFVQNSEYIKKKQIFRFNPIQRLVIRKGKDVKKAAKKYLNINAP